jgi:hypothetical protein
MVYLALTPAGLTDLTSTGRVDSLVIWVSAEVASPGELAALRSRGIDVTEFMRRIDVADASSLGQALDTIGQHHPGQRVWVEHGVDV